MKMKLIAGLLLTTQAVFALSFENAAVNEGYTYSSGGILFLSGKGISSLSGANNYTTAVKFDLEINSIAAISSGDFSGLSNLTSIDLDENLLTALSANGFSGLSGLDALYLQKNGIVTMDDNAFPGLNSIDLLYLRVNDITNISSTVFSNLYDTLTILSLASCKVSDIETGAFAGAKTGNAVFKL